MKKLSQFTTMFLTVLFLTACGGGGSGDSGSGSQDALIPQNLVQNGALGSWYISGASKPIPEGQAGFMYIQENKVTYVNICSYPDGSHLTAVTSAAASLSPTANPDVTVVHVMQSNSSRVARGSTWCSVSVKPATYSLQLNGDGSQITLFDENDNSQFATLIRTVN